MARAEGRLSCYNQGITMKKMTLEFTLDELGVLTNMASDQLFRKQFIDPKMPGFVPNHEELSLCKDVVGRLRTLVAEERAKTDRSPKKKLASTR
jgi:hypothetical protein